MAWSANAFGALPWGATEGAGPAIVGAIATRRNAVEVEFDGELAASDSSAETDVTNPGVWTIVALDGGPTPLVQAVEVVAPGTYRVVFDAPLGDGARYELEVAATVQDPAGESVSSPRSVEVVAPALRFVPATEAVAVESRRDLVSAGDRYDGTGDLRNEAGFAYLRKRLLRRATSLRGSCFHLPGYGAGPRLKALLTPATLARYRSELRAQVLAEPDVRAAEVDVERLAPNVVRVSIRPTTVDGSLAATISTTLNLDEA